MVLEATMIIVDNSEHSRNGDYFPSRFEAQSDAAHLIFKARIRSNPESSVGLMSMGAAQPEVLTTLTADQGKIVDGLHRIKIKGVSHLATALKVAGLALKHRQNKSQHQRIIVFTCSPLEEDEATCIKLAKRMKKNNIAVDIVCFGDLESSTVKKVQAFHDNIKSASADQNADDASNLAVIPPGPNLLSESLVTTPILAGTGVGGGGGGGMGGMEGAGGEGGGGDGGNGFEFGIDPSADPELALALRMSMEEEERRQREQRERETAEQGEKLESVPEGEEKGEGSGGGASDEKKDGEGPAGDQMDTS